MSLFQLFPLVYKGAQKGKSENVHGVFVRITFFIL